jgi:hypothetical protein
MNTDIRCATGRANSPMLYSVGDRIWRPIVRVGRHSDNHFYPYRCFSGTYSLHFNFGDEWRPYAPRTFLVDSAHVTVHDGPAISDVSQNEADIQRRPLVQIAHSGHAKHIICPVTVLPCCKTPHTPQ